jgi:hypothetical protein
MKSKAIRRSITVLVVVLAVIGFVPFVLVPKAVAQGVLNLVLYYRVRFEVLGQSLQGLHYTDLFDSNAQEITKTIMTDSSLTWESINILVRWQPDLESLVNGHGDEVILSESDVASVNNYLHLLAQHASPELKSVLEEELSAKPLEDLTGMNMNQAWTYLNDDSRFHNQILESKEFPVLKRGSTSILTGSSSENSKYEIDFDEETWALSSWNNGVADSWIAENLDVSDCTLTTPRSVSNPYAILDTSYKTLGNVKYKVETYDFQLKKVTTLYILFQPIDVAGQPIQEDFLPFILYPGDSSPAQCIAQGEAALGSLFLVSTAGP